MQVLALTKLYGDLQYPHGIIFEEEAVVCWGGNQRIQVGRPFRIVSLGHVVLQDEAHG
jgi:hypothetical protein